MKKDNSSFKFAFGIFMVIAYLGIAYLVVFTPVLIRYNSDDIYNTSNNDENFVARIILGTVLLIYGIFRGYRMWKINQ